MIPFLKWPGGKRWFIANHSNLLAKKFDRYIEPFLGGGSVYFHLMPKKALLGDLNSEVVETYQGMKKDPIKLKKLLSEHQANHSPEHYYSVRKSIPFDLLAKASRMIYLNRTCFNGIYRVNLKGQFNVPIGTRTNILLETDNFIETSNLLSKADIQLEDFESLIDEAQDRDFIFADPPYTVRHNKNGFIKYNEQLFSWSDQLRLANALMRARIRGTKVLATNANHKSLQNLYIERGFRTKVISRYSSISASTKNRKQFEELIIIG